MEKDIIKVVATALFSLSGIMIAILTKVEGKNNRIIVDILLFIMVAIMMVMTYVDVIYMAIYMPLLLTALQNKTKIGNKDKQVAKVET